MIRLLRKFRLEPPKDAANWVVAAFTVVLAFVAYFQWRVSADQLRAMQTDQRAWIQMKAQSGRAGTDDDPKLHLEVGEPLIISARATNVGKTPAHENVVTMFAQLVSVGADPQLDCVGLAHRSGCPHYAGTILGIQFPQGVDDIISGPLDDNSQVHRVTQLDRDLFYSGQIYVAVYGMATYRDAFGTAHWTKYCFHYSVNRLPAFACSRFNNTDDLR